MTNLDCIIIFMENYPVEKKKRRKKRPHCHRKTSFALRQFLPHTSSPSHRARVSYHRSIPVLLRSWVLMKHESSWRLCAISCVQQPADQLTRPILEGLATDQYPISLRGPKWICSPPTWKKKKKKYILAESAPPPLPNQSPSTVCRRICVSNYRQYWQPDGRIKSEKYMNISLCECYCLFYRALP